MADHIGQPRRCCICGSFEPCFVDPVGGEKFVWRCANCVVLKKWPDDVDTSSKR